MGYMFLDGLAYSSIQAGNEGCSWSEGGLNQEGTTITLDPGNLIAQSYLDLIALVEFQYSIIPIASRRIRLQHWLNHGEIDYNWLEMLNIH